MSEQAHSTPLDDAVVEALKRAPLDDEPETEEERLRVSEAQEAARRGEVLSTTELRRELGID